MSAPQAGNTEPPQRSSSEPLPTATHRIAAVKQIGGNVSSPHSPVLTQQQRTPVSRTSQLLFDSPVLLPLTANQRRCITQLDFFKRWYLLCHFVYICIWVLIGTAAFLLLVPHLTLVDAFFIAMSSVCNCGLQTVDVGDWSTAATLFRHMLLLTGGVVVTSAYQPLLRLFMLHRVRQVFLPDKRDTPQEAALRATKKLEARRLRYTALVSAVTPLLYFVVVDGAIMILLGCLNTSHLSAFEVFCMCIASFHSSIFLPMERYVDDAAVTGFVALACALGFTAFPVVLRAFMMCEWGVIRLMRCLIHCFTCCVRRRRSSSSSEGSGGEEEENGDEHQGLLHEEGHNGHHPSFLSRLRTYATEIDAAFHEMLTSNEPGTFHPFLFRCSDTVYLGGAWLALTLMQALPFWCEQWNGLLHDYDWRYKVHLAWCQAAVVRFAAASFVPLLEYSNAHVAVTILAMYLPALPISTDRTYRKWKAMFRTSIVRLLTSRLFWLFTAMASVLFAEEKDMRTNVLNTRFDIMTRTFFEVISAYAGCGLSLTLGSTPVSFVGYTGTFSKTVIAAVILGGRHRVVDLGIDLGFRDLQSHVSVSEASQAVIH